MAEQYSSLPNAFSKVITDLVDLMQKEMRLAQAELSEKLSISIRAGVWMSAAAVLAVVGGFLIVQAIVLG
ncbi:MAG: phage holin family protein, partial [Pseudolabrys sp.]